MNRLAPLLLVAAALALACCAEPGGAPGAAPAPGITVGFGDPALPENRDKPTIEVVAVTRLPIWRAELVMPDGSFVLGVVTQIEYLARPWGGYGAGPQVGVGVGVGTWGGSGGTRIGTGVGIGVPVYGGGAAPGAPYTRSRARIAPADMDAYRRDWPASRLRLTFGGGADSETVEIPAPTPGAR